MKNKIDYLILDSNNNRLATTNEKYLAEDITKVQEETEAQELYIYKAELVKTINLNN